jgi:hypothetical protein
VRHRKQHEFSEYRLLDSQPEADAEGVRRLLFGGQHSPAQLGSERETRTELDKEVGCRHDTTLFCRGWYTGKHNLSSSPIQLLAGGRKSRKEKFNVELSKALLLFEPAEEEADEAVQKCFRCVYLGCLPWGQRVRCQRRGAQPKACQQCLAPGMFSSWSLDNGEEKAALLGKRPGRGKSKAVENRAGEVARSVQYDLCRRRAWKCIPEKELTECPCGECCIGKRWKGQQRSFPIVHGELSRGALGEVQVNPDRSAEWESVKVITAASARTV